MDQNKRCFTCDYPSILGRLTLASDGESLTGLWMAEQKYYGKDLPENTIEQEVLVLKQVKQWLELYFSGGKPDVTFPLAPKGSDFRKLVWNQLLQIPYGGVLTYGEIAKSTALHLGRDTMSAQAVGGAVSHNPISIIIPCHRVVGCRGELTGYAGGLDRKIKLLELEHYLL